MTFKRLSEYFQQLESTSSRLKITEILATLFKEAKQEEIAEICYLSLGRLLPAYAGVEFQMAEKMMMRAVAKAVGVELKEVAREYKKLGDLGKVGEEFKVQSSKFKVQSSKFKVQSLLRDLRGKEELGVLGVYRRLLEIAKEGGEGSVERKIDKMAALLEDLDPLSVRYVIRMPLGKMRLGFSEMTILDALSWKVLGDKSLRNEFENAYNVLADIGEIARRVKKDQKEEIKKIKPKLRTPIMPALAQRIGTVEEMLEKMGDSSTSPAPGRGRASSGQGVALEPKYDGERLQIHFKSNKATKQQSNKEKNDFEALKLGGSAAHLARIFTRNLENVTHMFPDIVEVLPREIRASEVILDSEGVGIDPKTGRFVPFQETIKRKRKHGIKEAAKEIPVKCFVFDIMYKDGESLIKRPFWERRKILEKILSSDNKTLILTPQIITDDPKQMRKFHEKQIKKGLEGAMVKKIKAAYDPGRRGFTWVKFKQEETKKGGGLADTIDGVVMGIYRGKGKRASFGVGAFLVGVWRQGSLVTISKIGTGLSDEQWKEMRTRGKRWTRRTRPGGYEADKNLTPDSWLEPKIVVEIQADNITKSPIHTAGLALRFPRLVKFRDDKSADQATSLQEVEKLYKLQRKEKGR